MFTVNQERQKEERKEQTYCPSPALLFLTYPKYGWLVKSSAVTFFLSSHCTSILRSVPPSLHVYLHLGSILKPSITSLALFPKPGYVLVATNLQIIQFYPSSLSHTSLSHSFTLFFHLMPALLPPLSLIYVYLAFKSFFLPVLPHRTHLLSVKDHALVIQCLCVDAVYLCFHKCLSSLKSLSKLHSALTV